MLVDDVSGTTHQVYGGMSDPTYLIDVDGRVAFYSMWTHVPTLHTSLRLLMDQGGRGVVNGGVDHGVHLAAAITDGWRGLKRGLPRSLVDLGTAVPTLGLAVYLGHQLRPITAPVTLRAHPLPAEGKIGLAVGAGVVLLLTWVGMRRAGETRR